MHPSHPFRVFLAVFVALAAGRAAWGEYGYTPYNRGYYYYSDPTYPNLSPTPPDFDDRVFNVGKSKPKPEYDASGRPLAHTPHYTRAQRAEWIRECEYLEDVDFNQFQHCFREHKQRFLHPERAASSAQGVDPTKRSP